MKDLIGLFLLLFLMAGCSATEPVPEAPLGVRHLESGENTYFRMGKPSFEKYIAATRRMIVRNRVDITDQNRKKILEAISPFEWKPSANNCQKDHAGKYKNGVLLIHGLSDSPYLMKEIGRYFQQKCYLVRAILLPGHGTVPGDLLGIRFEEWIKASEYGINSFSGLVDKLSLVGFSTGGALSIYHALNREDIHSILLFSPALQIKNDQIFLSGTVKALSGVVDSLAWVDLAEDKDFAKYESFPINAAYQIYQLTNRLDDLLQKKSLKIPMFIAASQDDATIETKRTIDFFIAQKNRKNKMILYTNDRKKFASDRIIKKPGKYKAENITELSHLSILSSPENVHYGRNGDYRNCLHYLTHPEKMELCKSGKDIPAGEITESKMEGPVFSRITYNPDFKEMLADIDIFLESSE